MRFSKRWPRDTSEPAPTAPGRGAAAAPAGRVGAAGRPGVRSGRATPRDQGVVPDDEPRLADRLIALATTYGR